MKNPTLLLAAVLVAGLAVPALADTGVDGQVPFAFKAGNTTFPAGHYQVEPSTKPDENILVVDNLDTGQKAMVEYMTRIAESPDDQPALVFDDLGGQHLLSEVHLEGADGYLVPAAAKKQHTHSTVKMSSR